MKEDEKRVSNLGTEDLSLSFRLVVCLFIAGRKLVGAWKPACEMTFGGELEI